MSNTFTREQVVEMLVARLGREDGMTLKLLGKELGGKKPISPTYLNDVIKGRKRPGDRILKPLGLERDTTEVYRRVSTLVAEKK